MHRSWGFWLLSLGALGACGGRSPLGLASDVDAGNGANGGTSATGGALGVAGRGGGTGARGGGAGFGGGAGGAGGGGAAGTTGGSMLGGGAGGSSGAPAGGSAGTRPSAGDDASLYSLTVAEGYLSPKFDPRGFDYSVTIPRSTKTLTLKAIPNDPDAQVEVAGEAAVGSIEVAVKDSGTVPILVTAPSGASARTYVRYHRELVGSTTYLKPSSTSEYANFGISVAVAGDTVAVGAYTEVGADDAGAVGPTGAVYVYVKDADGWRQEARLTPSHRDLYDQFGYSVALSGETLVVGAPGEDGSASGSNGDEADNAVESAGAAYVFVRDSGTWTQQAYVKGATPERNAYFGASVALEGHGLVVGSPGQSGPDDGFGQPFAAGSATVLVREGASWSEQQTLGASNPSDQAQFGLSVALSGDTLAVGAPGDSSEPGPGESVAAGAAYVFVRSGTSWSEQVFIQSPHVTANAYFGDSVAVSGNQLVVGEPSARGGASPDGGGVILEAGAAYLYERYQGRWNQLTALLPSNGGEAHHFGARVAVGGGLIVVGAPGETGSSSGVNGDPARGGAYLSGAAYVFAQDHGTWYQAEYLKAVTSDPYDAFGISVGLGIGEIVVGAYGEASQATGVNGDSTDDSVRGAGAAYVYELAE